MTHQRHCTFHDFHVYFNEFKTLAGGAGASMGVSPGKHGQCGQEKGFCEIIFHLNQKATCELSEASV